jgi:hypothetical protein
MAAVRQRGTPFKGVVRVTSMVGAVVEQASVKAVHVAATMGSEVVGCVPPSERCPTAEEKAQAGHDSGT